MAGLFKKAAPSSAKGKKSDSPIFTAQDIVNPDGTTLYTKEQVVEAISGFAQGKELEKQGTALMETHKPCLGEFGRRMYTSLWASTGNRPKSPKLTTKTDGTGTHITMSFIDRQSLMNDDQYAELCNCIGAHNAEECVERFTQYSIDAKLASQRIKIKGSDATVQDHIEKALLAYFPEEHHELLGNMLKPKEVFQTKKGIVERGLDLVGRGSPAAALKLADFLVKARVIVAYKPGAVGEDSED